VINGNNAPGSWACFDRAEDTEDGMPVYTRADATHWRWLRRHIVPRVAALVGPLAAVSTAAAFAAGPAAAAPVAAGAAAMPVPVPGIPVVIMTPVPYTGGPAPRSTAVLPHATGVVTAREARDVRVAPAATDAQVPPNGQVAFQLNVANAGPSDAQQVRVIDDLAAPFTFISAPGCSAAGQVVTCARGTLVADDTQAFVITVRVKAGTPAGTVITNAATTSSDTADPDLADNASNEATVTVSNATADMQATESGPGSVTAGQDFTVTIGARNDGPSPATGVTVTSVFGPWLEFVSSDNTGCGYDGSARTITCAFGTVADGATVQATITLRPLPRTPTYAVITSPASVAATTLDPDPANNTVTIGLANADGKPPVRQP
jgi:uncharacterized repeat protein (TIGR01451 family)